MELILSQMPSYKQGKYCLWMQGWDISEMWMAPELKTGMGKGD